MAKRKPDSVEKLSWEDFRGLVKELDLPPMHSYEIVNDAGCVVAKVIGEEEFKDEASADITLSDVGKFFEKHADDFKEAQALIAKIRTAKKPLKYTKKELAEAKRRMAKFRKITEKVEERVYGKTRSLSDKLFESKVKLEKKLENRKRRQELRGLFSRFDNKEDRESFEKRREELRARRALEDREDLADARKAMKEKGSIPFDKLKADFTGDKKSKKGGRDGNRKTSKA